MHRAVHTTPGTHCRGGGTVWLPVTLTAGGGDEAEAPEGTSGPRSTPLLRAGFRWMKRSSLGPLTRLLAEDVR